jgi:hypothetical protein
MFLVPDIDYINQVNKAMTFGAAQGVLGTIVLPTDPGLGMIERCSLSGMTSGFQPQLAIIQAFGDLVNSIKNPPTNPAKLPPWVVAPLQKITDLIALCQKISSDPVGVFKNILLQPMFDVMSKIEAECNITFTLPEFKIPITLPGLDGVDLTQMITPFGIVLPNKAPQIPSTEMPGLEFIFATVQIPFTYFDKFLKFLFDSSNGLLTIIKNALTKLDLPGILSVPVKIASFLASLNPMGFILDIISQLQSSLKITTEAIPNFIKFMMTLVKGIIKYVLAFVGLDNLISLD